MVKKLAILLVLMVCALGAQGASYTSAASGMWSDPATWGGSGCPTNNGDTFTIGAHTVYFDCDLSSLTDGLAGGTINGSLVMDKAYPCFFAMNGNITGTGSWLVGDADAADMIDYTADNLPKVVIRQKSGTVSLSTAGNVKWYGQTNGFYGFITNTVDITADSTNLFFVEPVSNVASNDIIYIDNHNVRGAGGSLHMVYGVETNRITVWSAIPAWAGLVTNSWPGATIIGALTSNNRTNGSFVVKLSRPIVVYTPSRTPYSLFDGGTSNYFAGVRVTYTQRGLLNNAVKYTLVGCVGTHASVSTLSYSSFPTSSILLGCISAYGALQGGGYGTKFYDCIVCGSGSIANNAYNAELVRCFGRNTASGLLGACTASSAYDCWAANIDAGGIIRNGTAVAAQNCVVSNFSTAGIAYFGSFHVENCVAVPGATLVTLPLSYSTIFSSNHSHSGIMSLYSGYREFAPVVYNGTNFLYDFGSVILTNQLGRWVYAHRPSSAHNAHIAYYVDIAVKPQATRDFEIEHYAQSDCYYSYCLLKAAVATPHPSEIVALPTGSGWTNTRITVTNTLPIPQSFRLWVSMTNATAATEGWTRVNLPTDYTVRVQ